MAEFNPLDYGDPVEVKSDSFNPLDYGDLVEEEVPSVLNIPKTLLPSHEQAPTSVLEKQPLVPQKQAPVLHPIPEMKQETSIPRTPVNYTPNKMPAENLQIPPSEEDIATGSKDIHQFNMETINPQISLLEKESKELGKQKEIFKVTPPTKETAATYNKQVDDFNAKTKEFNTSIEKVQKQLEEQDSKIAEYNKFQSVDTREMQSAVLEQESLRKKLQGMKEVAANLAVGIATFTIGPLAKAGTIGTYRLLDTLGVLDEDQKVSEEEIEKFKKDIDTAVESVEKVFEAKTDTGKKVLKEIAPIFEAIHGGMANKSGQLVDKEKYPNLHEFVTFGFEMGLFGLAGKAKAAMKTKLIENMRLKGVIQEVTKRKILPEEMQQEMLKQGVPEGVAKEVIQAMEARPVTAVTTESFEFLSDKPVVASIKEVFGVEPFKEVGKSLGKKTEVKVKQLPELEFKGEKVKPTKFDPVAEFSDGMGEVKVPEKAAKPLEKVTKPQPKKEVERTRLRVEADEKPIIAVVKELGSLEKVKRHYTNDDDVSRFARETAADLYGGDANVQALTPKSKPMKITSGYEVQGRRITPDEKVLGWDKKWQATRSMKVAARKAGANPTEYNVTEGDTGWTFQRRKSRWKAPEKVETPITKLKIKSAAIKLPDNKLLTGKNHLEALEKISKKDYPEMFDKYGLVDNDIISGFIDGENNFLTDKEVKKITGESEISMVKASIEEAQNVEKENKKGTKKETLSLRADKTVAQKLVDDFNKANPEAKLKFDGVTEMPEIMQDKPDQIQITPQAGSPAEKRTFVVKVNELTPERIKSGYEAKVADAELDKKGKGVEAPKETSTQVLGKPGYKKGKVVPWKMEHYAKKAAEKKGEGWEAVEREDGWVIEGPAEKSKIDVVAGKKLKPLVPPSKPGKNPKTKPQKRVETKEKEVEKQVEEKPFKKKSFPEKEYDKATAEIYAKQAKKAYSNGDLEAPAYMLFMDLLTKKDLKSAKQILDLVKSSDSPNLADKIKSANVKGGADVEALISLLGAQMYKGNLAEVTIKETVQNSFDAVKASLASNKITDGKIKVLVDPGNRIIAIKDNGQGMDQNTITEAFLKIGKSDKQGLAAGEASGRFGMAKAVFIYGTEWFEIHTTKNGRQINFKTTPKELLTAGANFTPVKVSKEKHGTTLVMKIPEYTVSDGVESPIWFPYTKTDVSFFKKPLLNDNLEITFKSKFLSEEEITNLANDNKLWETNKDAVVPLGKHFDNTKYKKNTTATFDWGTADLYIGKDRTTDNWDTSHHILSAGIYQFNDSITIKQFDKVPYNIIVNVKPTVKATSPNYPFNIKREGWKTTVKEDISALHAYVKNVALGIEAQETVNQFKNIKSLELIDVGDIGTDNVDITEFITPKKKNKTNLNPTYVPPTVRVTGGKVIGKNKEGETKTLAISKNQEKRKSSFESGKTLPTAKDFLIETGVDDSKPIFHNNTNVDYFELAKSHGLSAEEFFAELGSAMLKVKEAVSDSSSWGYDVLTDKDQSFFFGISIDKGYHGVNTVIPFKAALLNPLAIKQRTLPGLTYGYYDTIVHELAHIPERNHDDSFISEMAKLHSTLASDGTDLELRVMLSRVLKKHQKLINLLRGEFEKSTTKNLAKSLDKTEGDGGIAAGRVENGSEGSIDAGNGKRVEVSGRRGKSTGDSRVSDGSRTSKEYVKPLLNEEGSVDLGALFELGESFYTGSKQKYFDWQKKVKKAAGSAWSKVKQYVEGIWKSLKKSLKGEEGAITLPFKTKELKAPKEYLGEDFSPFELKKGETQVNIGKEANKKIKVGVSDAKRFVALSSPKSKAATLTPTDYMFDKYPEIRNLLDQAREVDKIITRELEEFSEKLKVIEKKYKSKKKREQVGINWHYANKSGKAAMEVLGHERSEVGEYSGLREEIQPLLTDLIKRVNVVRKQLGKKPIKITDNYLTFYAVENYMNDFMNLTKGQDNNNIILDSQGTIRERQGLNTKASTTFGHSKREGLRDEVKLELDPLVIVSRYAREAINHIHKSPLIAFTREMLKADLHDPVTKKKISIGGNEKTSASNPVAAADISSWINKWAGKSNINLPRNVERIGQKIMDNLTTAQLLGNTRTAIVQSAALVPTTIRFGYYNTFTGSVDALLTDKVSDSKVPYEKSNSLPTASWDVAADNMGNAIGKGKVGKTFHATKEFSAFFMKGIDYLARKMTFGTAYRSVLPLVENGKLTEKQAIRIADSEVIRTQGSGSTTEISPIQRNVLGKMATLWQTHTINQANFFFRDVLGISGKKLSKGERAKRIFRTLFGVAVTTLIYEKYMGIQSPFPAPSSAIKQSIDDNDHTVQLMRKLILELSEGLPFGGSVKFGSDILGPIAKHSTDIVKALAGKGDFNQDVLTAAFSKNKKTKKRARVKIVELIGKTTGIPFTAQWAKYVRGRMRGESIPRALIGRIYNDGKKASPAEGSLNSMRTAIKRTPMKSPKNVIKRTRMKLPKNALRSLRKEK